MDDKTDNTAYTGLTSRDRVCALCNTASQITRPISSPIVRCEVTIPSGLAIVSKIIDTDVMLKSGQDKKGHKILGPSYFVTALVKLVCSL